MNSDYWGVGSLIQPFEPRDKRSSIDTYIRYMLNRTQSMFEYDGLPDTMPKRTLELYAQTNGHVAIIEYEGNVYSFFGNWGGVPNEYYLPTKYIIANPYLNLYKEYTVNVDCVVMANDSMYFGLMPMMRKYATMLCENDLTMYIANINSRIFSLVDADTDSTRDSAEEFFKHVVDGELKVIAGNAMTDGVRSQPYGDKSHSSVLTDLIEYHQYLRASWFNELGLNANYNMKRESIMSSEAALNDDMLLPLIDDMLNCRREACDKVNEMFGLNISVKYASSWEDNQMELETALKGGEDDESQNDRSVPDNAEG